MKNKTIFILLLFIVSCADFNTTSEGENEEELKYRIPLGSCSEFQQPTESFQSLYDDFFKLDTETSKGCSGSSCHSLVANAGGWNLGNPENKFNTHSNLVNQQGLSGRTLINPNDLEGSEILVRLSVLQNPMPRNRELWTNADLIRLKRWICQGAQNN